MVMGSYYKLKKIDMRDLHYILTIPNEQSGSVSEVVPIEY